MIGNRNDLDRQPAEPDDNPDWALVEEIADLDAGAKLRSIRARLALSQAGLARLLLVAQSTVQNWEQGRTSPDAFTRRMINVIYDDPEGMRTRLEAQSAA